MTSEEPKMTMRLNTLKPAVGSNVDRKRVGRGRGSGKGGTAGRGTKGQKSRSGGYHKVGFEGGQMPLQRRLPKRGFRSMVNKHTAEIRLHELAKVEGDVVDLASLQKAGVIGRHITRAKAILSGEIGRAVILRGVSATIGARRAIEKAGGTLEDADIPPLKPLKKLVKKERNQSAADKVTKPVANKVAEKVAKKTAENASDTPADAKESSTKVAD